MGRLGSEDGALLHPGADQSMDGKDRRDLLPGEDVSSHHFVSDVLGLACGYADVMAMLVIATHCLVHIGFCCNQKHKDVIFKWVLTLVLKKSTCSVFSCSKTP